MRVGVCHKAARAMNITLTSIGHVPTIRADPTDDNWDNETTRIDLDTTRFTADALLSLDSFSQVEVLYWFHHAEAAISTLGAHHPRDNTAWPLAGIFAQRGKNRPNRIGLTIRKALKVKGHNTPRRRSRRHRQHARP
jgi:tRNA (Thr-GGU) A37 N-methylase